MNLPDRIDLPFFSYGLFKPGQLGFFQLAEFVQSAEVDAHVRGYLLERDGLPVLCQDEAGEVKGTLLFFSPTASSEAYKRIADMEPGKLYLWRTAQATSDTGVVDANLLLGKSPTAGSAPLEEHEWDGRGDPLFNSALEVVQETLCQNEVFDWSLKPLFRLEMAYLLLWSSIERYVSLRHYLGGGKPTAILKRLADEESFRQSLKRTVSKPRELRRTDNPKEIYKLRPCEPLRSVKYYYQVRNNIAHRGKAVVRDFETVHQSLKELLSIFSDVRDAAFEEASCLKNQLLL